MTEAQRQYLLKEIKEAYEWGRGDRDYILLDILDKAFDAGVNSVKRKAKNRWEPPNMGSEW